MIEIIARAPDQEAFAPFGEALTVPPDGGRTYCESSLLNLQWRNATGTDEEFVDLALPVLIR